MKKGPLSYFKHYSGLFFENTDVSESKIVRIVFDYITLRYMDNISMIMDLEDMGGGAMVILKC